MRVIRKCLECGDEYERVEPGIIFGGNRTVLELCNIHQPFGGCLHPRIHIQEVGDLECTDCGFRWPQDGKGGWALPPKDFWKTATVKEEIGVGMLNPTGLTKLQLPSEKE